MGKIYSEKKINPLKLSAAMSVGYLLFCLVIPWHANSIPPATYLGIEVIDVMRYMYVPWVFLGVYIVNAFLESKRSGKKAEETT